MTYPHSQRDMEVNDTPGERIYVPVDSLPRDLLAKLRNMRSPDPASPDSWSSRKPSFDFRECDHDQEVFKTETTPLKCHPEDTRKEGSSVDENFNQTPRKGKELPSFHASLQAEPTKRKLFTNYEDFRGKRPASEGFRLRSLSDDYDDVMHRGHVAEPMSRLMAFLHKSSSSPEVGRTFFGGDTLPGPDRTPPSPCRPGRYAVSTQNPIPSSPKPWLSEPPSPRLGRSKSPMFFSAGYQQQRCSCESHGPPRREYWYEECEPPKKRICVDKPPLEFTPPKSPSFRQPHSSQAPLCTCAIMRNHFLRMAEHAYKNIRRKDASPASFVQFAKELDQTNETLLRGIDVLTTIIPICEHANANRAFSR